MSMTYVKHETIMTILFSCKPQLVALILAAGVCSSGAAMAADIAPMPTKAVSTPAPVLAPWAFSVMIPAWTPSLHGSTTINGGTTYVDAGFYTDILPHAEIPKDLYEVPIYFEARNGRFSIFTDLIYMHLGINAGVTQTLPVDNLNATVGSSAGLKLDMTIAELAAAYEVAHWGATSAPGSGTFIDIYGGARAWWLKADASLALSGTVNIGDLTLNSDGTQTASGRVNWVDPMVGVRLRHRLAPNWNLVASGDVGGFGAGSKFSWKAAAAVNYDFYVHDNVTWSAMLGYQALHVDYLKGSGLNQFEFDMTLYGPVFGISALF
jgi:hypothetical protein